MFHSLSICVFLSSVEFILLEISVTMCSLIFQHEVITLTRNEYTFVFG